MKNQSGAIKTNLELYKVVMGSSGGHRKLPGGSDDFSWQTDTHTLHHNIYIIIIIITIIIIIINLVLMTTMTIAIFISDVRSTALASVTSMSPYSFDRSAEVTHFVSQLRMDPL